MTRFHLHCSHGDEIARDYVGADFPNREAALDNAQLAAEMLRDEGAELGEDRSSWRLIVADEQGREFAQFPLRPFLREPARQAYAKPAGRTRA